VSPWLLNFLKSKHKNTTRLVIFLIIAAFFVWPKIVFGQVVINEIAWMGTLNSTADEWMELYNNSDVAVDLNGWKIIWGADNKYSTDLAGQISANGYFLLERTNDDSVPGIAANQIYAGALSNSSEHLKLFNTQNNLIDEINATDGWPAGENTQKLTMERTASGTWQNSTNSGGTPKTINSSGAAISAPTPSATPSNSPVSSTATPTPLASATPIPIAKTFDYSQNILINEFLPNPETGQKEWVELINTGSSTVNLTGWQIDDDDNSTKPQMIPEDTVIPPSGFLVIAFNKSTLNNDGDKVQLLWPDDQVVHSVSYAKSTQGQSVAKFATGWLWTNQPTPGQVNKKSASSFSSNSTSSDTITTAPNKIETKEESVAVISQAPSKSIATPKANIATASISPTVNQPENINLTAAASEPIKKNSKTKTFLYFSGIILLAALAASGLIYFRRLKAVDTQNFDD
jgi:hypothetical protein